MPIDSLSIKPVSRLSIICTIAIALLLLGPNPAKAESREQAVDRETIATPGDCVGDAFWDFDYSSHGRSLDRIADTIWEIRDPSGDKNRADVSKQEWNQLRRSISREHFCY